MHISEVIKQHIPVIPAYFGYFGYTHKVAYQMLICRFCPRDKKSWFKFYYFLWKYMHIDARLWALVNISTLSSLIPTFEFIWIVTRQAKGYQSAISKPKLFWDGGAQWWKLCYTLPDQWIYCLTGLFSAQCHWKCRHWSLAKRAIHHLVQDIGAKIMYCTLDKKSPLRHDFKKWF